MANRGGIFTLFLRDESGQGLAEYALALALIAIVSIAALSSLGITASAKFASLSSDIANEAATTNLISYSMGSAVGDLGPYPHSFLAEEGMTWGEFIASEYNTYGIYINSSGHIYLDEYTLYTRNNSWDWRLVSADDPITLSDPDRFYDTM